MLKMKRLHKWNLTFKQAIMLQKRLARRVKQTPVRKPPLLVAGLDCAFSKDGCKIIAAVVVVKLPLPSVIPAQAGIHFEIVETTSVVRKLTFPYIPGLLSFREAPACLAAVEKLKTKPDLFIVDGQGIAHPRRFGIASHLGLFLDKPTIGCAKSRLIGDYEDPPPQKGAYSLLKDKGETIGAVLRTRTKVKPLFVSVGNKCTLEDAVRIVLSCTTRYRLPEPARLAHQMVGKLKWKV